MKTKIILVIFGFTIAISSCSLMIKSLNPFYKQKDLAFNKDLLGTWIDPDSSLWILNQYKFKKSFTDLESVKSNSYELIVKNSSDGDSYFNVFLFTINGEAYFDFFPIVDKLPGNKLVDWHMIPVHSLAKLKIWGDRNITFFWYSEDWFNDQSIKNKLKVSYETIKIGDKDDEEMNILTASTGKLQKFIAKSGKEKLYRDISTDLIKNLNEPEKIMNYIQDVLEQKDEIPFPEGIKNTMIVNLRKVSTAPEE